MLFRSENWQGRKFSNAVLGDTTLPPGGGGGGQGEGDGGGRFASTHKTFRQGVEGVRPYGGTTFPRCGHVSETHMTPEMQLTVHYVLNDCGEKACANSFINVYCVKPTGKALKKPQDGRRFGVKSFPHKTCLG